MARCGFATQKILPQNATQGKIVPRKVLLHTAVDGPGPTSLFNWFQSPQAKGAESTFYVRTTGEIEEYMDSEVRADAQWAGNVDAISIETEDDGNPNTPWTDAQVASIIRLVLWCIDMHPGILPQLCPTSTGSGIGWHEKFPEWNRSAHRCPGPVREAQIRDIVMPAITHPSPLSATAPWEAEMLIQHADGHWEVFDVAGGSLISRYTKQNGLWTGWGTISTAGFAKVRGVQREQTSQNVTVCCGMANGGDTILVYRPATGWTPPLVM